MFDLIMGLLSMVEHFFARPKQFSAPLPSSDPIEKNIPSPESNQEPDGSSHLDSSEEEELMFLRTEHHLDKPICQCYYSGSHGGYEWGIWLDKTGKAGLLIVCKDCDIELRIPNSGFKARILVKNADEEKLKYNQAKKKQEFDEEKKFVPKVLEFPNREEDQTE